MEFKFTFDDTAQIPADSFRETALSQVFIACDLSLVDRDRNAEKVANQIITYIQGAKTSHDGKVRYPGERTLETRKQNLEQGIPVAPQIWKRLRAM